MTAPDATFLMMKEDHNVNGQLKAGYNARAGTEDGFVGGHDIFPNLPDSPALKPRITKQGERLGGSPKTAIADAGHGGEERYQYPENKNIKA